MSINFEDEIPARKAGPRFRAPTRSVPFGGALAVALFVGMRPRRAGVRACRRRGRARALLGSFDDESRHDRVKFRGGSAHRSLLGMPVRCPGPSSAPDRIVEAQDRSRRPQLSRALATAGWRRTARVRSSPPPTHGTTLLGKPSPAITGRGQTVTEGKLGQLDRDPVDPQPAVVLFVDLLDERGDFRVLAVPIRLRPRLPCVILGAGHLKHLAGERSGFVRGVVCVVRLPACRG